MERPFYGSEYKPKNENKTKLNEYKYFGKPNFVGFNRMFVLVYLIDDVKRFKAPRYYLPKTTIKNYSNIVNAKKYYNQPIDSHINI